LTSDEQSEFLGLDLRGQLPTLPTVQARTAWLLGRVTDKAPTMVRPLIRSMLLPKLEQLDEASLTEALGALQTTILPWLIGDNDDDAIAADEGYVFA
jgi:hypothetical protein